MVSLFNQDFIDFFILKTKQLGIFSKMWCGSKKSYVLNRSCTELSQSEKERRGSNPFCFSIPLSYFNLLENDFKGEEFHCFFSSCTNVRHCFLLRVAHGMTGSDCVYKNVHSFVTLVKLD